MSTSQWRNRIVDTGVEAADQLLANPWNARIHPLFQQKALEGVLDSVGWVQRVIVNRTTGHVLDGHLRVALAITRQESVPVDYVELTEDEEKLILATFDYITSLAVYDKEGVKTLLGLIPTPAEPDVKALLAKLGQNVGLNGGSGTPPAGGEDLLDQAGQLQKRWDTHVGELWLIGKHKLLIGDATSPEAIARLMNGDQAECLWTDPPYGVSYEGKTGDSLEIENDDAEGLEALLQSAFAAIDPALIPGAALYIAHPGGRLSVTFGARFLAQGWRYHETLIWVKDSMVLGHSDYHYRHEPILFGYKPGGGRRGRGAAGWYGDNAQTSVFEIDRPTVSSLHPTQKPVELVAAMLVNSSAPEGIVLDPFGGSGSTMKACEWTQRCCRMLELSPKYAAVILQGMLEQQLTPERSDS